MASIITDEGLDFLIGVALKGQTQDTSLWLGLFASQTATTVPGRTATGGASPSGWTEVTGTSYARVEITSAEWGANSTSGNGRLTAAAQQSFAAAGGPWAAANGFFIATHQSSQAGDVVIMFSNFADGQANTLLSGDVQQVTPSFRLDGVVA